MIDYVRAASLERFLLRRARAPALEPKSASSTPVDDALSFPTLPTLQLDPVPALFIACSAAGDIVSLASFMGVPASTMGSGPALGMPASGPASSEPGAPP
ncbi:MAG TPA: hypothetical protein VGP93_15150, partial [Polyangiaceae bacterium]|nr:hypothetical protein [Polyangiaceae bacterium]